MDRMIYNAMAGAKAAMQRQEVLSNNLANVSTTGFRAEMVAFRAVPVQGDGAGGLKAVLARHDHVHQHEVGTRALHLGESVLRVLGGDHFIASAAEHAAQAFALGFG